MESWWLGYGAAFAASLLVAWALTPLMMRLAQRFDIFDRPAGRKSQESAVPYLGGVAIALGFSAAILLATALVGVPGRLDTLAVILATALALTATGLVDDLRGLPAWVKLAAQVGAGVVVWSIGSGTTSFGPEWANLAVTVLWVVGITNAFNLLDNMDGLSAGVAVISAGALFLVAALNGQVLVAALAAALAGCAAGFLRHNFYPARIYMGDAGSLFLGFLLAVVGARLRLVATPQVVALFVPVLALGVAIFDTTLVTVSRIRHGRSPFTAGRDHTSHRLVYLGVPVPVAVGLIYTAGVVLGVLALIMARLDVATGLLLGGLVLALGILFLALFSYVPVYENSRRRRSMVQVVRQHEEAPGSPGSDALLRSPRRDSRTRGRAVDGPGR